MKRLIMLSILSLSIIQYTINASIHDAVEKGDKDTVERMLTENSELVRETTEFDDDTPLHTAAMKDFEEIAQLLIEYEADTEADDVTGNTPLHLAAVYNSVKTAEVLLDNNANINAKNDRGETPLHLAAERNNTDIAKIFVEEYTAEVNMQDDNGNTPIHLALLKGNQDVANVIATHAGDKIDLTITNNDGQIIEHLKGGRTIKEIIEN